MYVDSSTPNIGKYIPTLYIYDIHRVIDDIKNNEMVGMPLQHAT